MFNRAVALVPLLMVLSFNARASARVVILQPVGQKTAALEGALQRIAAELRLESYAPRVQPWVVTAPSVEQLEAAATQQLAFGALVLLNLPEAGSVQVLSFDGTRKTWVLRTVALEQEGDAASVLSIRAVEIMRAHFLERRYNPEVVAPARIAVPTSQTLWPHRWMLGVRAARVVASQADGVRSLRLDAALSLHQWAIKATVVPVSTSIENQAPAGAATMSQQSAWLSGAYLLRMRTRAVIPYVAAHAGAARLQAHGSATLPYQSTNAAYVTTLFGAGAGSVWWVNDQWGLSLNADVLWFASGASLQIDGVEQRRLGQPQLLASLGAIFSWGQGR
ncbi:MAG: hypothetical protein SF187_00930 [Deltaproteobacteria bacterium]|nr:hypothetical protein [Deltaproteobacteria bacterium]